MSNSPNKSEMIHVHNLSGCMLFSVLTNYHIKRNSWQGKCWFTFWLTSNQLVEVSLKNLSECRSCIKWISYSNVANTDFVIIRSEISQRFCQHSEFNSLKRACTYCC